MQNSQKLNLDELIEKAKKYLDNKHPLQAFPLLEKVYNLSHNNNISALLLKASYNGIWAAYGESQFEFMEYLAKYTINLIDDALKRFYDLDLHFKQAKAYNGLAIALYNLGKTTLEHNIKANGIYDNIISKSNNKNIIKSKIKNDFGLAINYGFANNLDKAIAYAKNAINLSRSYNLRIEEGQANKVLAGLLLQHGKYDKGFYYLKKAANCFISQNTKDAKKFLGNVYILFCESYFKLSMFQEGKAYLDYSNQIFDKLNYYTYEYYALLANYLETINDKKTAKDNYLHAISLLNLSKWGVKLESNMHSFLSSKDKEEIYLKAISALLDDPNITSNIKKGFELFESFRSKLFMENILSGRHENLGISSSLLKERHKIVKKLKKLYSKKDYLDNLDEINTIEKMLYYCDEKIVSIKGGYKAFVEFKFNSLIEIQNHIPNNGLVLEYFYYDDKIYIFLIGNKIFDCIYIDYEAEELEAIITGYLNAVKKNDDFINSFYENKALNILVYPILSYLDSIKELIIIPYNILHSFPVHSLFLSVKKELLISYMPNLQSISTLKAKSLIDDNPMIIGDPRNNLKGSLEEANTIKNLFHNSSALIGGNAKKEIILKEFAFHSIIHYSGHIRFNLNKPLYSYLECSHVDNNNHNKAGYLDDSNEIFLKEIYKLNLSKVNFLSLSGCTSGLSTRYKGEELVGLVRGFFYAGVTSILATIWDIEDQSSKDFMVAFFKKYIEVANKKKAFNYAYNTTKEKYKSLFFYGGFILYEGF